MREDICSIPINDIFKPLDGCPFCTMRNMLEDAVATYITGAAMMEPSVRVETNKLGFCKTHFEQILMRGSRLSVALILESLLKEMDEELLSDIPYKKYEKNMLARKDSCFICENVNKNMINLSKNTLNLWQKDEEFRQLYSNQKHICLEHYNMITALSQKEIAKKNLPVFAKETKRLCKNYMDEVRNDVTHFCRMFDYRNAGGDWGNSKDSIERAIEFLTSRKLEVTTQTEGKNR